MSDVVVVQPIDPAGVALLRRAGLDVYEAPDPSLATIGPHLAGARAVITRNLGFPAAAIAMAPRLRLIASHGTGTDAIDRTAAAARGIAILNTPGTNAQSVAEHALALMLACARDIPSADRAVRAGAFGYRDTASPIELGGRTLGLVGYGRTARALARMAQGLGMHRVAVSSHAAPAEMARDGVKHLPDLDTLLAVSDIVSLHGLPGSHPPIDASRFARMRVGSILINTARGVLLDEAALVDALVQGRLSAAALDVFETEPLPADSLLCDCPRLILSPHLAGTSDQANRRTALAVARKVIEALGIPIPAETATADCIVSNTGHAGG